MAGMRRGSLTRELLVKESLRLLDNDGLTGFSLPKLGRAIGADPTAIYRHFASKDDLVLAIADALLEEASAGLAPGPCWAGTLDEIARRIRRAPRGPVGGQRGPAEMRMVDMVIGAVLAAGFAGAEAATLYRAFGNFAVFWSGGEAVFLALGEKAQRADLNAWTHAYLVADRSAYPSIWRIREHLPSVADDDEIFETSLSFMLAGLAKRAPNPCMCGAHAG